MKIISSLSILLPIVLGQEGYLFHGYLDKCLNLESAAGEDLSFHYKSCGRPTFKKDGTKIKHEDGNASLKIQSSTIYNRLSNRPGGQVAIRADGAIINAGNGLCIDTKKEPGNFVERPCQGMVQFNDNKIGYDIDGYKIQPRCWRFTEHNVLNAGACEVKYNDRQWFKANKGLLPDGSKPADVFKFTLDSNKNVVSPMNQFIEAIVHRHRHGQVIYQPTQILKEKADEDKSKYIMFQDTDGLLKFRNNDGTKCIEKIQYKTGQVIFGKCLVDSFQWVDEE